MIISVICWSLINYGLTNIVVYSKLFEPLRDWFKSNKGGVNKFIYELITCPMCFSVWSGFFVSVMIYSPTQIIYNINPHISWFYDGIMSSGIVWIINSIVEFFEEYR